MTFGQCSVFCVTQRRSGRNTLIISALHLLLRGVAHLFEHAHYFSAGW
jgi:hypothetical protein